MDHFCYLCFVFPKFSGLFIIALWSPWERADLLALLYVIFSSPEPKAQVELILWDSSRRPCMRLSVLPHFHT